MERIDDVSARVRAGIAYLDAVYGKRWRRKVDWKRLDLARTRSCPLGQTDSDYNSHLQSLGLSNRTAFDLGFHINPTGKLDLADLIQWASLTKVWKRLAKS